MANTLPIGDTISAAWNKIYGAKASFWVAIIIAQIIPILLVILCGILTTIFFPLGLIAGVATALIAILLQIGLYYMGIMRAANTTVNYKQLYYPLSKNILLNSLGLVLLQSLIMIIPGLLALAATYFAGQNNSLFSLLAAILYVISLCAGLYLILGMLLAMGFVLTKGMNSIDALKKSYEISQHHLFEMFVIYIIFAIIYFLLGLPFGIGLIWGMPFSYVLYGEIFQRLSGQS